MQDRHFAIELKTVVVVHSHIFFHNSVKNMNFKRFFHSFNKTYYVDHLDLMNCKISSETIMKADTYNLITKYLK